MNSSKEYLLNQYKKDVEDIRKEAEELNLSTSEIDELFEECFKELKIKHSKKATFRKTCAFLSKLFIFILLLIFVAYVLLNVHQPTSSIVLRNVQGLIYPGLKILRFLAVPVLKQFPSLTNLYDETCLVENPFFYVADMECWPCENVHTVVDLTGFNNHSLYQSGIPYIVKTKQKNVSFKDLQKLYATNKIIFDKDATFIKSTNTSLKTVGDLLNYVPNTKKSGDTHISWRINRMAPARLIRTLFPKPFIVSERAGQSMERYVMIDEPFTKGYSLPNLECSYVFVIQAFGERTIILRPSRECGSACRTVSVVLKPSYVLWYNWWYWRPISYPRENNTETSISYISCYY